MDQNGDGIGDFEGLCRRLDYLQALGVDTLWLAPFQPSPNQDNGYDISDYYGVDPRHGSSGSFVEFMHQAAKRGLKVIIDLVVNHTSDQHPWFREARSSPDARYRDWYVWSKKKPHEIKLNLRLTAEALLQDLMANTQNQADAQGTRHLTLAAYGYRWYRAGNLGHLF